MIFTIGTQKMNLVNFVRLVKEQNITSVVDIRGGQVIASEHGKFSPKLIKEILSNIKVDYVHLNELTETYQSQNNDQNLDLSRHYSNLIDSNAQLKLKIQTLFSLDNVMVLSHEADYETSIRKHFVDCLTKSLEMRISVRNLTSKDLKPIVIPPPLPPPDRG